MKKQIRPLKRSVLIGTVSFIILLCIVLSTVQYIRYRAMLYERYEIYIENILNYAAGAIDTDDLAECIRTGQTSEKYQTLQELLDSMRDRLDIHFIYVIEPLNTEPVDNIKNIIAGVSQYEYETIADELVYLNMLTGDSYSPETAGKYLNAYNSGKLSFFEEISEWGDDYTGLLPLYDSAGHKIAALCVDVDIASIRGDLMKYTASMILTIMLLGGAFVLLFYLWAAWNVTYPLEQLESSVADFAASCQDQKDPDALNIHVPAIHTNNEVESLATAVRKMSEAMQGYVKSIVYTESELARMAVLANKDSLTGVRNKNAYDAYAIELQAKMRTHELQFAIVMMDLNSLKTINDAYGHEKGDIYIQQCCGILCKVFSHSPVFRIGGDEFVAVLLGSDYENRSRLLDEIRAEYDARSKDTTLDPWERCSAAVGIAEYEDSVDESVETILKRADIDMYSEKTKMKQSS